jgi:ubiquinone biosynthesis protein UbiJ
VLHHRSGQDVPLGTTHFTLAKRALVGLVPGQLDLPGALGDGSVQVDGDPGVLARLVELLAPVDPDFAIVTP